MGFGNMGNMLRDMQRKMERIQEELGEERIEGTAGGGMVTAVADGMGTLHAVRIKPEVIDPDDAEMLEDLVVAAVNDALTRANERRESRMGELAGGMNLPGMPKLPKFK